MDPNDFLTIIQGCKYNNDLEVLAVIVNLNYKKSSKNQKFIVYNRKIN